MKHRELRSVILVLGAALAACSSTPTGGGGNPVDAGAQSRNDVRAAGDVAVNPDAAATCAAANSCGACTPLGACGWCGRTGRCMVGGSSGSADMSCTGNDWAWTASRCGGDGGVLPAVDASAQCATATTCSSCAAMSNCGWCGRTGRCLAGGSSGASDMSCSGNEWAWISSRCGADGGVLPPMDAGPVCRDIPRDCGLTLAGGVRTCTAGQRVSVGCSAACGLGSCTGDAVIQICPGSATTPCTGMAVVASNDDAEEPSCSPDAGSELCPLTSFTCPADGRYTVWTGAYNAASMATCTVAVR